MALSLKKIQIKFDGSFNSHNVKRDGTVVLSFKAPVSEMAEMVGAVRFISKRATVGIKAGDQEIPVGRVVFNRLQFDKEGEATLTLLSDVENMKLSGEDFIALVDKPVRVYLISMGG